AQPTGDLGEITVPEQSPHRDVMMPTRRQTREQDRQDRITKERQQRQEINAEERRKHAAWLAANYEPPPF
ncbi:MAG: HNH endonuclease, partial [Mycobacterium sp.]